MALYYTSRNVKVDFIIQEDENKQKLLKYLLQKIGLKSFLSPADLMNAIEKEVINGDGENWDAALDLKDEDNLVYALCVFFFNENIRSMCDEDTSFDEIYAFIANRTVRILLIVDVVELPYYFDLIKESPDLVDKFIRNYDVVYYLLDKLNELEGDLKYELIQSMTDFEVPRYHCSEDNNWFENYFYHILRVNFKPSKDRNYLFPDNEEHLEFILGVKGFHRDHRFDGGYPPEGYSRENDHYYADERFW
jgi:hypothetical protein